MRRTILTAGAAVLAVAGGGAAIASTTLGSPEEQSKAVIEDAARNLGVTPAEPSDALKDALGNRVDEAVDAGRLTGEQGEELRARIESQDYPLLEGFGLGHHGARRGHGFGHFEEAAAYLGMTEDKLRDELAEGKTLAEVAEDEGKSVEGLVSALVADETKAIAQAVLDGRLTQGQQTGSSRPQRPLHGSRERGALGSRRPRLRRPAGAFPAGPHDRGDPM